MSTLPNFSVHPRIQMTMPKIACVSRKTLQRFDWIFLKSINPFSTQETTTEVVVGKAPTGKLVEDLKGEKANMKIRPLQEKGRGGKSLWEVSVDQ